MAFKTDAMIETSSLQYTEFVYIDRDVLTIDLILMRTKMKTIFQLKIFFFQEKNNTFRKITHISGTQKSKQ